MVALRHIRGLFLIDSQQRAERGPRGSWQIWVVVRLDCLTAGDYAAYAGDVRTADRVQAAGGIEFENALKAMRQIFERRFSLGVARLFVSARVQPLRHRSQAACTVLILSMERSGRVLGRNRPAPPQIPPAIPPKDRAVVTSAESS